MNALLTSILVAALATTATAGELSLDRLLSPLEKTPAAALQNAPTTSSYTPPRSAMAKPATGSATLGGEELQMEIERQLREHFATDGEVKVSLLRTWAPVALAANEWTLIVTEWPTNGIASTFFMRFQVLSGGQVIAECQMPLKAQLLQEVWMSGSRLERGQPLDRSLLAVQKVNVIGEHAGLIPAKVDPSALEVLQPVPAGRALTRRDVGMKPVIRKGQVVEAGALQGRLAVKMKAVALESGAVGDLIKLRNLESRKDFNGQILNESKVQVHF